MIQMRQLKIQEIEHSVDLSNEDVDREISGGVEVFTVLKQCVERSLNELTDTINEKQRTTKKQAEDFIKELQQEISALMKRSTELEQLSHSEDHLHLLQKVASLSSALPTKDWADVCVHPTLHAGTVLSALDQLEKMLCKEIKQAKLKLMQQYAVDVTLDPETAHCTLVLSNDGKQVKNRNVKRNVTDHPKRFSYWFNVLGKQSCSSGKFYYEVQVTGKNEWYLGVARQSMDRKGEISLSPQHGYWTLWLRNKMYTAGAHPGVLLSLKSKPQKVGVFVDYEEGLIYFCDVDAANLIYSFTGCSFTEELYPFFNPGKYVDRKNSTPLIISPVNHTE